MVARVYYVDVGGHVLTIMGDGRGQFQWTDSPENACLDLHIKRHLRIHAHHSVTNGVEERWFAFAFSDNDNFRHNPDSIIQVLMLYLCTKNMQISNPILRNLLANHIEENLDSWYDDYDPYSSRKTRRFALERFVSNTTVLGVTVPPIGNRANIRVPGTRVPFLYIQAFCDVFGYACETWRMNANPKTQREVRSIVKSATYLPNQLPGYPYNAQDLQNPVRFLDYGSFANMRLLGKVLSSYDVDLQLPAPVIDLR